MKIPVKYETQLDYQYMQSLFTARKALTDAVIGTSGSYSMHDLVIKEYRIEITELDNLILKLAGKL